MRTVDDAGGHNSILNAQSVSIGWGLIRTIGTSHSDDCDEEALFPHHSLLLSEKLRYRIY